MLGYPQRALHKVQGDASSIRGEVRKAYRYPLKNISSNAAPLALARMVPDSLFHPSVEGLTQVDQFCRSFGGPVKIVWGKNDPILGRSITKLKKQFKNADITMTEGGNFLQEEEDEVIAEKIMELFA